MASVHLLSFMSSHTLTCTLKPLLMLLSVCVFFIYVCLSPLGWWAIPEEHPGFSSVSSDQSTTASGATTLRVFLPKWELSIWGARHAPACGTTGNHDVFKPHPFLLNYSFVFTLTAVVHRQHFELVWSGLFATSYSPLGLLLLQDLAVL